MPALWGGIGEITMRCGGRNPSLLTALLVGSQLGRVSPVQVRQPLKGDVRCPKCGYSLKGDFVWCPNCGARSKPYLCAYCQGLIPVDAESCVHCGAPIQ